MIIVLVDLIGLALFHFLNIRELTFESAKEGGCRKLKDLLNYL